MLPPIPATKKGPQTTYNHSPSPSLKEYAAQLFQFHPSLEGQITHLFSQLFLSEELTLAQINSSFLALINSSSIDRSCHTKLNWIHGCRSSGNLSTLGGLAGFPAFGFCFFLPFFWTFLPAVGPFGGSPTFITPGELGALESPGTFPLEPPPTFPFLTPGRLEGLEGRKSPGPSPGPLGSLGGLGELKSTGAPNMTCGCRLKRFRNGK